MLLQIRDYIHREGIVSTQQLMREFHLELLALQPMLDIWIRKGVIAKCNAGAGCKTRCFKCSQQAVDYYQCC